MKPIDLQTLLQDTILTADPLINPHLHTPPKGTIADRVAIYTNGYYGRLEEVLKSDYEILAKVMGEEEISSLCRCYITDYPSHNNSLNHFGEHLSDFLSKTAPYDKAPHLAEIAAFEWAENDAIIAPDAMVLSAQDLQILPADQWPELTFHLHPSCQILTFHSNSYAMINAVRAKKTIPKPRKLKVPQRVLLWRLEQSTSYCALNTLEHLLLNAIKSQATFTELCEKLSQQMPEDEVAGYLVKELYAWLHEKLFIRV